MRPKILYVFFILTIVYIVQGYVAPFNAALLVHPRPKPSNAFVGFGGSQECVHANTTYGRRIPGDWKAFSEVISKRKSFLHKTTVEMKYPSNGSKSYCQISWINVENLYRKCKCYKETVQITEGGIGKGNVSLKMTTDYNCPNEHRVTVYTRC